MLTKSETGNNCIVVKLANVRKHSNADRLQLATVLGTTVVVGLDAKEGDLVLYFDSNLRLSHEYLHHNNLYSDPECNLDKTKKGYFGKSGRVRAQKFRGEVSNGYVAPLESLYEVVSIGWDGNKTSPDLEEGDEFTHINNVEICSKYVVTNNNHVGTGTGQKGKKKIKQYAKSDMFHTHWDTKQLMREKFIIPEDAVLYIEEKEHGTSGRTGNVLFKITRPWWKFWLPKVREEWRIVSGTRRVDNINAHISKVRKEVENKIAPHLRKGEEVYYEIDGYDGATPIQSNASGNFEYGCRVGEYRAMLYRVTITTPDGFCFDLSRPEVYRRAEELGLEKPFVLMKGEWSNLDPIERNHPDYGIGVEEILKHCSGKSWIDHKTLLEGVVVWFQSKYGSWTCLKHKSEEFLIAEDKNYEKGNTDVEDAL
jgi:hypothetical protein